MNAFHYLDENPGGTFPVLLLHGLGADSSSWQLQFPALIDAGFRLIAPDLPGFGLSKYDGRGWSIHRIAVALAILLDGLGLPQTHVVGISMGGTIALQMAIEIPERVDRLILVNTFSRLRPEKVRDWLYFIQRIVIIYSLGLSTQARLVAGRIFPNPEQEILRLELIKRISQSDPRAYRQAMRSLGLFNVHSRLKEIMSAILFITGENDTTVPRKTQRQLVENIPHAEQVIIPGAGHAVSLDQPDLFNREMLKFLLNNDL